MNMEEVNKIIKKHDELLDSMSFEEKKAYYASYGIKEKPKNNHTKTKTRIKRGRIK